jgi:hypothetical protein
VLHWHLELCLQVGGNGRRTKSGQMFHFMPMTTVVAVARSTLQVVRHTSHPTAVYRGPWCVSRGGPCSGSCSWLYVPSTPRGGRQDDRGR